MVFISPQCNPGLTLWVTSNPIRIGYGNVPGENLVAENPSIILPQIEVVVFEIAEGSGPLVIHMDRELCCKFALYYCLKFIS